MQMFGDSQVVINWIKEESRMANLVLSQISDEVKNSLIVFNLSLL